MRRLAGGLAATLLIAACLDDQAAGPLPPALTTAQLALYYDSLAGVLSPSDSRIHWLQQIDNGLAFGAPPTPVEIDVAGRSNLYWAVAYATITPISTRVDSTYVLAAWTGDLMPFSFLEVTINYVRDTAESQVVYYADSTAPGLTGSNTVAAVQGVVLQGACTPVTLVHLYTLTGACTLMHVQLGYQSSINGMPFRAMAAARLTPAG
ncbi:MAG TPA: hypothetical protein VK807_09145 [Gemmatimonadaceae bacterium]|jgi:hypothetical protein|nr:hypothetical protein [Gemmatimonadaceae bacterium]